MNGRSQRRRRRHPAPFVVGVWRSGTTLLRMMLDAHPELAVPPETHFAPSLIKACRKGSSPAEVTELLASHRRWGDFGLEADELRERLGDADRVTARRALRTFYELYAEHQGKPRWGDKTPAYVNHIRLIAGVLPEARFVHLIRDGRDVALSIKGLWFGPDTVEGAAEMWAQRIGTGREQARDPDRYLELRYEDLVADPESQLRRVCSFVELGWDPIMLRHHEQAPARLAELAGDLPASTGRDEREGRRRLELHGPATAPPSTDRVARWQTEMNAADIAAFEAVAGELLAELGYELAAGARRSV
jgi:Sulfotransferase family